jgi:putative transposase
VDAAGAAARVEPCQAPGRPWWADNSKEAYSSGLDGLARALKSFTDSRHGRRKGRRVGFPRFKRRGRRDACRFTTGAIRALADRKHVQLPRIGVIKTHESTRKLARHLERGTGRILAATITRTAGRWYVAFTCEIGRQLPTANGHTSTVGVDVGIRQLAVLSTGEQVPNPRPLERAQRQRRRLQRQWSRQDRQRVAAGRTRPGRRQQQTRQQLARVEARVACIRRDGLPTS